MNGIAKWAFTLIIWGHEVFTIILWQGADAHEEYHGSSGTQSRHVVGFRGRQAA